jgi:hypothetical protein
VRKVGGSVRRSLWRNRFSGVRDERLDDRWDGYR